MGNLDSNQGPLRMLQKTAPPVIQPGGALDSVLLSFDGAALFTPRYRL
jgi:hypothetical protein